MPQLSLLIIIFLKLFLFTKNLNIVSSKPSSQQKYPNYSWELSISI